MSGLEMNAADRAVISAFNEGDVQALALALKAGGARRGTEALKLLISAVVSREGDSLHLRPKRLRGQKNNPLPALGVRATHLRNGLPPDVRSSLVQLLEDDQLWIGLKRHTGKRGPRAGRPIFSKLWKDGWRIAQLMREIGADRDRSGQLSRRGIQQEAIDRFLAKRTELGSREAAVRYAKRALAAARALDIDPEAGE